MKDSQLDKSEFDSDFESDFSSKEPLIEYLSRIETSLDS